MFIGSTRLRHTSTGIFIHCVTYDKYSLLVTFLNPDSETSTREYSSSDPKTNFLQTWMRVLNRYVVETFKLLTYR